MQSLYITPRPDMAYPRRAPLLARSMSRPRGQTGVSEITNDSSQFQVRLDVSHFLPSEVTVKALDGGKTVLIEGRHEEKQDEHGFVSRQFTRKYLLPSDADLDKISSALTPEGILTVSAPKKPAIEGPAANERVVPIALSPSAAALTSGPGLLPGQAPSPAVTQPQVTSP